MKNIQNKALANETLNIKGASYTGDHEGVFEMEDEHAKMLLATPKWLSSKRGPEAAPVVPVAATNDGNGDALAAVKTALLNATGQVSRLEAKLRTSEVNRADLQTAVKSRDAEIDQLKKAAELADLRKAIAPPPVPPAPGSASSGSTPDPSEVPVTSEDAAGPKLEGMDKPQLLAVAEKWEVSLTVAQKKLGADKLRAVLDEALYTTDD